MCDRAFARRSDLGRHRDTHNVRVEAKFKCTFPGCSFRRNHRSDNLRKHISRFHGEQKDGGESRNFETSIRRELDSLYKEALAARTESNTRKVLLIAVRRRNIALVQMVLYNGSDLSEQSGDGKTAVHIAAINGDAGMVAYLSTLKININALDMHGKTASHYAALNGHIAIIKLLLQLNCRVDCASNDGHFPIHDAAQNGHIEIVEMLFLRKDCTSSLENMMVLAAANGHVALVEFLVGKNVSVDSVSSTGESAIWKAADNGHEEVVEMLLRYQAKTEPIGKNRCTPLCAASKNGHLGVVRTMLAHQVSLSSAGGNSALELAALKGHQDIVEALLGSKLINSQQCGVALRMACMRNDETLARVVESGADLENKDSRREFEKNSALKIASSCGNTRIVELLLRAGADIDGKPGALLEAVEGGHEDTVSVLINAGLISTGFIGRKLLLQQRHGPVTRKLFGF